MTILTSIILVVAIVVVALLIAYNMQKGTKTLQEFKDNYYDNEQVHEIVDLAQELYDKDSRPIVVKQSAKVTEEETPKTKQPKAEFPIDKPKKKKKYYPKAPKGKA